MKIGDYVGEITNDWQKHNKWMEIPDEEPSPLGVIVARGDRWDSWKVMTGGGVIRDVSERCLKVLIVIYSLGKNEK